MMQRESLYAYRIDTVGGILVPTRNEMFGVRTATKNKWWWW